MEDQVVFVGEVERTQLMLLYAACDAFLLPTRILPSGDTEGFGIVFLEANLMGRPVIGGRGGGTEDAIVDGQTGLLVDANDTRQTADAAIRLLADPAYANLLGQQGKEKVLREFDMRIHRQSLLVSSTPFCYPHSRSTRLRPARRLVASSCFVSGWSRFGVSTTTVSARDTGLIEWMSCVRW